MKYLLRIKGVSDCAGMKRTNIAYTMMENGKVDLSNLDHPLKTFKNFELKDGNLIMENINEKLPIGEEVSYSKTSKSLLNGKNEVTEYLDIRFLVLPLDKEAIDYYKKAIEDGYIFDAWDGEFEYIIGLIYEEELNDEENAKIYFDASKKKRFRFGLINKNNA